MGAGNNNGTIGRLGSTSYDIDSVCFDGKPALGKPLILPDGPSKSVLFSNRVSFGFETHVGHKYADPKDRANDFIYAPIVRMIGGEPIAHLRTGSSNEIRFPAFRLFDNDKVSPVYMPYMEDFEIQKWRDVSQGGENIVSYYEPSSTTRFVEFGERLATFDSRDPPLKKYVSDVIYLGEINDFGVNLSRGDNLRQDLRINLFDETRRQRYNQEMLDFVDFLNERYGPVGREVAGIGIEEMPGYAGIFSLPNEHSVISAHPKWYEMQRARAERHGLKGTKEAIDLFKMYTIYHELVHNFQHGMSRVNREIDVGEALDEYFTKKADSVRGTDKEKYYRALAANAKLYEEMMRKHGKEIIAKQGLQESKNLESLIEEFEAEARSMNLDGEERKEYINKRLEEVEGSNEGYESKSKHNKSAKEYHEEEVSEDYMREDNQDHTETDDPDESCDSADADGGAPDASD